LVLHSAAHFVLCLTYPPVYRFYSSSHVLKNLDCFEIENGHIEGRLAIILQTSNIIEYMGVRMYGVVDDSFPRIKRLYLVQKRWYTSHEVENKCVKACKKARGVSEREPCFSRYQVPRTG
jgi:hypothetical protein